MAWQSIKRGEPKGVFHQCKNWLASNKRSNHQINRVSIFNARYWCNEKWKDQVLTHMAGYDSWWARWLLRSARLLFQPLENRNVDNLSLFGCSDSMPYCIAGFFAQDRAPRQTSFIIIIHQLNPVAARGFLFSKERQTLRGRDAWSQYQCLQCYQESSDSSPSSKLDTSHRSQPRAQKEESNACFFCSHSIHLWNTASAEHYSWTWRFDGGLGFNRGCHCRVLFGIERVYLHHDQYHWHLAKDFIAWVRTKCLVQDHVQCHTRPSHPSLREGADQVY